MFSHLMVGSNDLARSRTFYDAVFAVMGAQPGRQLPTGRLLYAHAGNRFLVGSPRDGGPATHANGGTIGFELPSAEHVDAWQKAGVESGGTAIEDPPGLRPNGLYLAYLRDPDGNKLCAVYSGGA